MALISYQRKNPRETTSMERISRDFRYLFSFGQKLSWMAEMMRSIWKNWVAKPTMRKREKKVMRNTLERKVARDQNIPWQFMDAVKYEKSTWGTGSLVRRCK